MKLNLKLTVLVVMSFVLAASVLGSAQSASFATINGRITDPQGAVVPNATVTAKNLATGVERSATSTGSGIYSIPNLSPGDYEVRAQAGGFSNAFASRVHIQVGDQRDVNFQLAVAGASTTVEVSAASPLIETNRTAVATSVTDVDMARLPVLTNPYGLTGVSNDYAQLALTAPGVRLDTSTILSDLVAPGSFNSRGNLYNVDGANITDQSVTSRNQLGASVDEIKEFQVITNNYNAEYGQATGLILNAVTKSGTNGVHGDAHMYFRGRNLRSSDPFYNYGLVADGVPVEGARRAPYHKKEGGFTIGGPIWKDHTFWFLSGENTRQGVPQQLNPPSGTITVQQPTNELLWSAKLDHQLTKNNLITARYNVQRDTQDNLVVQTGFNITADSLLTSTTHDEALNIGFVSSITPNLVNEARFFRHRTLTDLPTKTSLPGQQHANFYTGAPFCCPQAGLNKRYQYIDNLTWTRGSHTFKTGTNISYYPYFSLFAQFHFGQYTDFDPTDTVPGTFIIGLGPAQVRTKDNIYGFYGQDTWKVTRKLTLNYGLRWDGEAGAFKGGTVNHSGSHCLQANGIVPACSSDYNNFQPRFGFTYAPWEGTLFKASFAEMTQLAYNNIALDSLNFDGVTLNTAQIDGSTPQGAAVLASFPNTPSPALVQAAIASQGGVSFGRTRPISDHLKNPEVRSVNVGLQHQWGKSFVTEIQYVGAFGFGEFGERDTNARAVLADPAHPGFFYWGDKPDDRFTNIRTQENTRSSHYNGLVVSGTKRASNHVGFQGSYTWSHTMTSGEDFFGLSEPADPRNIHAEFGPAYNDVRHAANFGVNFDTEKLIGGNMLTRFLVNNWVFGITSQLQSGRPYPVSTGVGAYSGGRFFGVGNETSQRPNVLADGTIVATNISTNSGANLLVGPNGAALCGCPQTTFLAPAGASPAGASDSFSGDIVDFQQVSGNLSRNAGRGSPFYRADLSVRKVFRPIPSYEQLRVELVGEFFNLFNHPNWQGFNTNDVISILALPAIGDPNFANCTNCLNPFTGQYVGNNGQVLHIQDLQHGKISKDLLNPAFGGAGFALGGLGEPATAELPRQIQLSVRVRF